MMDILPWAQYDNVKKWILVWIATPLLAQCLAMTEIFRLWLNMTRKGRYLKKWILGLKLVLE